MANKAPNITSIKPIKQRFIHLYITGAYSKREIAELLGIRPDTLSKWMKDEKMKTIIEEYQNDSFDMLTSKLKTLSHKAVNKLDELMDSPMDYVALGAAKDVLDRSGHKAAQEIKVDKTVTYESKFKQLIDETLDDDVDDNIIEADYEIIKDGEE